MDSQFWTSVIICIMEKKVAFGTITQLVLEDIPAEELEDIID